MANLIEITEREQFEYWNGLSKERLIKYIIEMQKQLKIINISSDQNKPKFTIYQEHRPIIGKVNDTEI